MYLLPILSVAPIHFCFLMNNAHVVSEWDTDVLLNSHMGGRAVILKNA